MKKKAKCQAGKEKLHMGHSGILSFFFSTSLDLWLGGF
jgi:hypothetical protein